MKLTSAREGSSARFDVRLHHDQRVPLADGVVASADVYLPRSNGPFPTVVQWTPYESSRAQNIDWAVWYAERGFAAVVQDVRGRYESEGVFSPTTGTGPTLATPSIGLPVRAGATDGSVLGVEATERSSNGNSRRWDTQRSSVWLHT